MACEELVAYRRKRLAAYKCPRSIDFEIVEHRSYKRGVSGTSDKYLFPQSGM